MSDYQTWKEMLHSRNVFTPNDGRFPDGMSVCTRYPTADQYEQISWNELGAADYVSQEWPWQRGRVLGQIETDRWMVLVEDLDPPMICDRTEPQIRPIDDDIQAILVKHQELISQAMQTLQGDLRAYVDTFQRVGLDEDLYETNALSIYNEAYDLRETVASFFSTWID